MSLSCVPYNPVDNFLVLGVIRRGPMGADVKANGAHLDQGGVASRNLSGLGGTGALWGSQDPSAAMGKSPHCACYMSCAL